MPIWREAPGQSYPFTFYNATTGAVVQAATGDITVMVSEEEHEFKVATGTLRMDDAESIPAGFAGMWFLPSIRDCSGSSLFWAFHTTSCRQHLVALHPQTPPLIFYSKFVGSNGAISSWTTRLGGPLDGDVSENWAIQSNKATVTSGGIGYLPTSDVGHMPAVDVRAQVTIPSGGVAFETALIFDYTDGINYRMARVIRAAGGATVTAEIVSLTAGVEIIHVAESLSTALFVSGDTLLRLVTLGGAARLISTNLNGDQAIMVEFGAIVNSSTAIRYGYRTRIDGGRTAVPISRLMIREYTEYN